MHLQYACVGHCECVYFYLWSKNISRRFIQHLSVWYEFSTPTAAGRLPAAYCHITPVWTTILKLNWCQCVAQSGNNHYNDSHRAAVIITLLTSRPPSALTVIQDFCFYMHFIHSDGGTCVAHFQTTWDLLRPRLLNPRTRKPPTTSAIADCMNCHNFKRGILVWILCCL